MKVKLFHVMSRVVVTVDSDTLLCDGGKLLPYPAYIGTVNATSGKVEVWMPATYTPRGYKPAARRVLEAVAHVRERFNRETLPQLGQPGLEVEVTP